MLLNKTNLSLLLLVQQAAQVLVEIDVSAVVSDAVVAVGVRPPAHLLRADAVANEQVDQRGSVLVVHIVGAETVLLGLLLLELLAGAGAAAARKGC